MTYQPPVPPAAPYQQGGPTPRWAPLYGASPVDAVRRFFTKYADFTGRASRSEYWWVALFEYVVTFVLGLLAGIAGSVGSTTSGGITVPGPGYWIFGILLLIWGLGTIIPFLALIWRRLHDANFAGPWWFISFIPFGSLVILVFTILPSNPLGARFDRPRA
ncbi:MAG: DUF805 domain-containing protein [Leifsonia sp.]